ncbi:MAG: Bax inhibitor-1/YccA family protein [Verrucomicrobiota bacterium]|nr:Bax inhibitor-1/YccA family protein [Verrucomicrobiota bacterium]
MSSSFRSGNPALGSQTFNVSSGTSSTMTLEGSVNKTGIGLFLLMLSAYFTWNNTMPGVMVFGAIGGFIVALVTIFKKHWSPITVPIYAILEGLFLGGISQIFEKQFPGIVTQAIILTLGILGALLIAYKSKLIKPTENFKLGVSAATGGIFLVYLINFIMGFFGSSIPMIHESGLMGIGFSIFVVIIASLNLVLDFDFIEQGAEQGAPKYMEWYGAFGLMVTLIWLYLEILRLLAKLQSNR